MLSAPPVYRTINLVNISYYDHVCRNLFVRHYNYLVLLSLLTTRPTMILTMVSELLHKY